MKRTGVNGIAGSILLLAMVWAVGAAKPARSAGTAKATAASAEIPTRHFEFTYQVHVPAVTDAKTPLRIWVPVPSSSEWQTITDVAIDAPVKYKITNGSEFGNRMAYWEVKPDQLGSPFDITLHFTAARREHKVGLSDLPSAANMPAPDSQEFARFLKPDRLVPIDGMIGDLSEEQTSGAVTPLEKARKIYEYVVATMRYDKTGTGWGTGDAIWACTAKRGNCTDFHALFDGMARAAGIPARFEIGFPLAEGKPQSDIAGYHCWTEFYLNGVGWVPIDASEAWKHSEKHDYFFGANDVNRIQFAMGRDLKLNPPQQGEPLNYFVYPYGELDGKTFDKLTSHFAYKDLPEAQ